MHRGRGSYAGESATTRADPREVVGSHATLEHLGTGGFASTFKVTKTMPSAGAGVYALKVVDAAQADAERTDRELAALQRVDHPKGWSALTDRPPSTEAAYPDGMVNPALQSAIEAMSLDERLELVEYIESTVESAPIEVTEEQRAMIRSRAAELQADPSIGLTWDELKARLAARRA